MLAGLEVADIFRHDGSAYIQVHDGHLAPAICFGHFARAYVVVRKNGLRLTLFDFWMTGRGDSSNETRSPTTRRPRSIYPDAGRLRHLHERLAGQGTRSDDLAPARNRDCA